jgi:hypothetical protein
MQDWRWSISMTPFSLVSKTIPVVSTPPRRRILNQSLAERMAHELSAGHMSDEPRTAESERRELRQALSLSLRSGKGGRRAVASSVKPWKPDSESLKPRAPGRVRCDRGQTVWQTVVARLACRRRATARTGADPSGPARALYRPPCMEHRPDRECFPRAMERGGTLQTGQKGWCRALGAFASMVRQLLATTHLRDGNWPRTGQPGPPRLRHPKVRKGHDEDTIRDRRDIGASPGEATRTPCHDIARPGSDPRTTGLCRHVQSRALDACIYFI